MSSFLKLVRARGGGFNGNGCVGEYHSPGTSPAGTGLFFFFNDTATTEIYTLSLHDAFPICLRFDPNGVWSTEQAVWFGRQIEDLNNEDRKSTRLNSSHVKISYAVFCLK